MWEGVIQESEESQETKMEREEVTEEEMEISNELAAAVKMLKVKKSKKPKY